jgi:hypothetical protein
MVPSDPKVIFYLTPSFSFIRRMTFFNFCKIYKAPPHSNDRIRATPTTYSYCFPSVKFIEKHENCFQIGSESPCHTLPPAREYWRAWPPRKSARDPHIDPSHPSPCAKISSHAIVPTHAALVPSL